MTRMTVTALWALRIYLLILLILILLGFVRFLRSHKVSPVAGPAPAISTTRPR
jgi:hypothetical protein